MQAAELSKIQKEAKKKLKDVTSLEELEGVRVELLGQEGRITIFLRSTKDLSGKEKEEASKKAKEVRNFLERAIEKRRMQLEQIEK